MKYYLDTEFIERFHKPFLGKSRHVIDLISIGIVAEDGRKYYAISNEYRYKDASEWVQKNVILPMYHQQSPSIKLFCEPNNFHTTVGKSNKQIAKEIIEFCRHGIWNDITTDSTKTTIGGMNIRSEPEFYGYYADYDWVLFCSLFGTMMQLPLGFPMYCIDLKQTLDEHAERISIRRHVSKDQILKELKSSTLYPRQSNEHNAIADAKWNKELHHFLNNLK